MKKKKFINKYSPLGSSTQLNLKKKAPTSKKSIIMKYAQLREGASNNQSTGVTAISDFCFNT